METFSNVWVKSKHLPPYWGVKIYCLDWVQILKVSLSPTEAVRFLRSQHTTSWPSSRYIERSQTNPLVQTHNVLLHCLQIVPIEATHSHQNRGQSAQRETRSLLVQGSQVLWLAKVVDWEEILNELWFSSDFSFSSTEIEFSTNLEASGKVPWFSVKTGLLVSSPSEINSAFFEEQPVLFLLGVCFVLLDEERLHDGEVNILWREQEHLLRSLVSSVFQPDVVYLLLYSG